MKRFMMLISMLFILSLGLTAPLQADCHGGKCPMKKGGHGGEYGREKYQCPIVDKFMKKAHFFLENQKELGLSEEQAAKIKSLKMEAKKNYIRQSAEMQVFQIDIHEKMSQPKIDLEGLNAMIDKGMAEMSTSAKASVAAYAELKGVLSEDQMAKAKQLWMGKKN